MPKSDSGITAEEIKNTGNDDEKISLVDVMYDKINEALGGDKTNQYFCLTFPRIILPPYTHCYDYQKKQPMPPADETSDRFTQTVIKENADNSLNERFFNSYNASDKCTIEIEISVAKLPIERDWFNPGLFTLPNGMHNVVSQIIARNNASKAESDGNRLEKTADCALPCFPTALAIARNITIKLTTESAVSNETATAMEQHASKGGGFLFFSGGVSSSSSNYSSNVHVSIKDNITAISFISPQAIGYYIEENPDDVNTAFYDHLRFSNGEYVTMIDFISRCEELFLQRRKETLNE